jgi:hypothetical protein
MHYFLKIVFAVVMLFEQPITPSSALTPAADT